MQLRFIRLIRLMRLILRHALLGAPSFANRWFAEAPSAYTQAQFAPILEHWDLSQSRSRPSRGSHVYMLCSASDCVCMSMSVCLYMCVSLRVYVCLQVCAHLHLRKTAQRTNHRPITTCSKQAWRRYTCQLTLKPIRSHPDFVSVVIRLLWRALFPQVLLAVIRMQMRLRRFMKRIRSIRLIILVRLIRGIRKYQKIYETHKKHKVSSSDHVLQGWPVASKDIS